VLPEIFGLGFDMLDVHFPGPSPTTPPPLTRRNFLRSCSVALGALATGSVNGANPLQAAAEPTAPDPAQLQRTFHLMPHSHIDVEWYWTFPTAREWTCDILDKAMALLRQDPDFRFTQDQVILLRSYWDALDAAQRAFFQQVVKEGRFAIVGGLYVQPEVAEPAGESLVRQILLGQTWLFKTFGLRARCAWFIDTFGQIPQLPQILCRAGFDSYVFWRDIPPNFPIDSLPADFYCESPDGSRILTHWLAGGYSTSDSQVHAVVAHSRTSQLLLPFGSDVSRPTLDSAGMRREMTHRLERAGVVEPAFRVSTPYDYFKCLRAAVSAPGQLPVIKLDFNPPQRAQDLRGTYDNRIELKIRNRVAEQALCTAESLAAQASLTGLAYPQSTFHDLWEHLLFTHFHDVIGGSSSDPVYLDAMQRLQSVIHQADALARTSFLQLLPPTSQAGNWIVAHNSLSFTRDSLCQMALSPQLTASLPTLRLQDSRGRSVPFRVVAAQDSPAQAAESLLEFVAQKMPATGFQAYRLAPGPAQPASRRRQLGLSFLENHRFRLEWNPRTGDLSRLYDKQLGRECLAGPGNAIVVAKEKKPDLEGNLHLTGEQVCSSDLTALSISLAQDNLALRLQVHTQFPDFLLEREIALYEQLEWIDFRTTLRDFSGGDVLIKASFAPRLDWPRAQIVYETPFAATPRPAGHFAAQTWVDCSDRHLGLALLNRGTPGYWVADSRLELILLRSFANYTGYRGNGQRKGVPGFENSTQTELAREHGTHQFHYGLLPHSGGCPARKLAELGQSYNTPLLALSGFSKSILRKSGMSFIRSSPGFLLTAIKQAENGSSLVIRGYETGGQAHRVSLQLPQGIQRVDQANLLEEPIQPLPISRGRVSFPCQPHEIATFLLHF
jgi:alpha-mannosidase